MAALNFKEIAAAGEGPDRDQFELFAREFLMQEGFGIISGPDRGQDAGRDIIAEETRIGPGGETKVRWLVSCKHRAHSGSSVAATDEANIRDRIETHDCAGFIAFYSTLPSSGLSTNLRALQPKFNLLIYDAERIESRLLENPKGRALAARFVPKSFNAWMQQSTYAITPKAPDPHLVRNTFFLREPHSDLSSALGEAAARQLVAFVVIYDPSHPQRSKINYALGYFMEYQTTKRLVDEHFVPVVGPNTDPQLAILVPEDDPLELCLWVVQAPNGDIIRRESVYANPDEGMKRVRDVIRTLKPRSN